MARSGPPTVPSLFNPLSISAVPGAQEDGEILAVDLAVTVDVAFGTAVFAFRILFDVLQPSSSWTRGS